MAVLISFFVPGTLQLSSVSNEPATLVVDDDDEVMDVTDDRATSSISSSSRSNGKRDTSFLPGAKNGKDAGPINFGALPKRNPKK